MNDYEIARFSKVDVREFWSHLVERKTNLAEQLKQEQSENQRQYIHGQIDLLNMLIHQLEKDFDLF
ncbi:MAG TPA: hypothetical protein VJ824_08785 [Bacillota bacterium]|nr:hypothetical protein [Bacillota bacterium]